MEFGYPEMIVILVMLLLLFGGRNITELSRGLAESIRSFQNPSRRDWRKPMPQQEEEPVSFWPFVVFVFGLIVVPIVLSLLESETVTGKQLIVLTVVLSSWIAVGYFCFGRSKENE